MEVVQARIAVEAAQSAQVSWLTAAAWVAERPSDQPGLSGTRRYRESSRTHARAADQPPAGRGAVDPARACSLTVPPEAPDRGRRVPALEHGEARPSPPAPARRPIRDPESALPSPTVNRRHIGLRPVQRAGDGLEHTRGGRSHPLGGKVGLTVRPEPPDRRWLRRSPRPRSACRGSTRERLSCRPHRSRHRACPRRCRSPDHPSPATRLPFEGQPKKAPSPFACWPRGSERGRLALKSWTSRGRPDCVILPDSSVAFRFLRARRDGRAGPESAQMPAPIRTDDGG